MTQAIVSRRAPPAAPPPVAAPPVQAAGPARKRRKSAAAIARDDLGEAKAGCRACASKQRHPFRRAKGD
jgi:hypothetical protein